MNASVRDECCVRTLTTARERRQKEKIHEALPMAQRLPFDRLDKLFGRENETALLKACFEKYVDQQQRLHEQQQNLPEDTKTEGTTPATSSQISNQTSQQQQGQLILLAGPSGTGKSALGAELQRLAKGGYFCRGKYDLQMRDQQPFVGISQACNELCDQIKDKATGEKIGKQIGLERMQLLSSTIIPGLKKMMGSAQAQPECNKEGHLSIAAAGDKEKLGAAFRSFLRAVSSALSPAPIVLMIDDLQWADSSSLTTLQAAFQDTQGAGILVLGAYRSNEVSDDHELAQWIRKLKTTTSSITVTQMSIGNLSVDSIREMICDLLNKDPADTASWALAEVVHSRTQGNVFFVRIFLSKLVDQGYLKFHIGIFQWDWDLHTIQKDTNATDNLVDIIHSNLKRMQDEVVNLLKIASTLGNTFDQKILWRIWNAIYPSKETEKSKGKREEFESLLKIAVQELCLVVATNVDLSSNGAEEDAGTIHRDSAKTLDSSFSKSSSLSSQNRPSTSAKEPAVTLHFFHDNIQEAVISLMTDEEALQLQRQVGRILLDILSEEERRGLIFVVTNLLNSARSPEKEGRTDVAAAELNHQAALGAMDAAAFSAASTFARKGIQWIPPGDEENLGLLISLHSLGARAEQLLGHIEESERLCAFVMHQRKATPLQKCPVYNVKLDLIHNKGQMVDGLNECLKYLAELGCQFPKRRLFRQLKIGRYVEETKSKYLPSREALSHMPMMDDPVIIETIKLLERAGSLAFIGTVLDLYVLIRCRVVRLIGKYGLIAGAAGAYASFATALMHLRGEVKLALQLAELSLAVQDRFPIDGHKPRTIMTVYCFLLGWSIPPQTLCKHFLEGYRIGLQTENTFSTSSCLMFYLNASLVCGSSLAIFEEDAQNFVEEMERLGAEVPVGFSRCLWQLVRNLSGNSENKNTILLSGDIMDEEAVSKTETPYLFKYTHRHKLTACMYFGEYEAGANLVFRLGGMATLQSQHHGMNFGTDILTDGVIFYAMARRTKQAKYTRVANQLRKKCQDYARAGCVNLVNTLALLDGEFYALKGRAQKAEQSYSRAILEAARSGWINIAAIASERYGDYLLEVSDNVGAATRMKDAIRYYNEWGASRVAELLSRRHEALLAAQSS